MEGDTLMAEVDTLIEDIYKLLETKQIPEGVDIERECEAFGRGMADTLREQLQPYSSSGKLRLSAIGKPDRQLYHRHNGAKGEELKGSTYVKFLYGHLVEGMLLALTSISGHSVTDEQKEVTVNGVKGHMDGRIDGVLMDVKSCSSFGFKKFRDNKLHKDDSFGYIAQLKAYAHAEGDTTYGWLAMDKQNGTLAWLQYDETDTTTDYYNAVNWNPEERVGDIKKLVGSDLLPVQCYEEVPDGKSGNMKLAIGCSYCDYKSLCFPALRTYYYAGGPRYLTVVAKEPRVLEVPDDF
jgi:hypothetical protein